MSLPAASPVLTEVSEHVLTLRLNRPEKKNALTGAMYRALADALAAAQDDTQVRCILLTGTPDCFTSGNDIHDFLQRGAASEGSPAAGFMQAMLDTQKPVIAAVNGLAIGIGVTVLLHCDLAYAGSGTRFQAPFVNIGIVQEFGSSHLLPALMGQRRAAELVLLGEPFTAQTAREYGLVNAVCPDAETEATARRAALRLAGQPPAALRAARRLLRQADAAAVAAAMHGEAALIRQMLTGPEALEAMSAFVQKRRPDFSKFT